MLRTRVSIAQHRMFFDSSKYRTVGQHQDKEYHSP